MDIKEQVRAFVISNFFVSDPVALGNEDSLLDRGIIDSTGVIEIIIFIEETFGFPVDGKDTLPENLDSIERIAAFIVHKKGANYTAS